MGKMNFHHGCCIFETIHFNIFDQTTYILLYTMLLLYKNPCYCSTEHHCLHRNISKPVILLTLRKRQSKQTLQDVASRVLSYQENKTKFQRFWTKFRPIGYFYYRCNAAKIVQHINNVCFSAVIRTNVFRCWSALYFENGNQNKIAEFDGNILTICFVINLNKALSDLKNNNQSCLFQQLYHTFFL